MFSLNRRLIPGTVTVENITNGKAMRKSMGHRESHSGLGRGGVRFAIGIAPTFSPEDERTVLDCWAWVASRHAPARLTPQGKRSRAPLS